MAKCKHFSVLTSWAAKFYAGWWRLITTARWALRNLTFWQRSYQPSQVSSFILLLKWKKIPIFSYFIGTPGLSETAKLLLEIEWRKFSTALRNHLQLMLGSKDAMEKRFAELIALARAIFHAGNVFMKTGQVLYYFKNALIFAINF